MADNENVRVQTEALRAAAPKFEAAAERVQEVIERLRSVEAQHDPGLGDDEYAQAILGGENGLHARREQRHHNLASLHAWLLSYREGALKAAAELDARDERSAAGFRSSAG